MAAIGTGGRAPAHRPRRGGPFLLVWVLIAAVAVIFSVVTVWQFSTLLFGTPGTGRVLHCGRGDDHYCTVAWTAGDRTGTERMEIGAAPGSTIPVRVSGDDVVDARLGSWIYTIAMMLLFLLAALATVVLPAVWFARRSRARTRVRRHLDESGEQVLRVGHAAILHRDGTLFATLHSTHPGPGFPPSSCRITVTSPAGAPYYTAEFGLPTPRRGETVVYAPDGRLTAIVRRQLVRDTHADVFGPDEDAGPLATISPADRLGPVERAVVGPRGERLGTVLANEEDAPEPTVLGLLPGAPEPLRAGVLGFALTRERFYLGPPLEQGEGTDSSAI